MTTQTIKQLNQLNADFYNTIATDFSDSRQYAWEGWQQLIKHIQTLAIHHSPLKILDLGCGNGRFVEFLNINFPETKFNYLGIDNSRKLLTIAENKFKSNFKEIDIIDLLVNKNLEKSFAKDKYNLIVAFGLMHHIPSFELRKKLIKILANLLDKNSYLILAFWQFHKSERLMKKVINSKLVDINKIELEENDFILDWQRGKKAYRYCHYSDDAEIEKLTKESNLQIVDSFLADGKEGDLNKYVILRNHPLHPHT